MQKYKKKVDGGNNDDGVVAIRICDSANNEEGMDVNKVESESQLPAKFNMNEAVKLRIDKLRLRVDPDHCSTCKAAFKEIALGFSSDINSFMCGWSWKVAKTSKEWSLRWTSLNQHATLCIKFGQSRGKQMAMVDFNPMMIDSVGWARFDAICRELYPDGYGGLMNHCPVRRIDFACDVADARFSDYAYLDTRLVSLNDTYGKHGTYYVGAPTSQRRIACYDKQRQLKAKYHVGHDAPLLRIEARQRGRFKATLQELLAIAAKGNLKNPFASTVVVDRGQLKGKQLVGAAPSRFRSLLKEGFSGHQAYRDCLALAPDAAARKAFKNRVSILQPGWWKPATIWKQAHEALLDVFYGHALYAAKSGAMVQKGEASDQIAILPSVIDQFTSADQNDTLTYLAPSWSAHSMHPLEAPVVPT